MHGPSPSSPSAGLQHGRRAPRSAPLPPDPLAARAIAEHQRLDREHAACCLLLAALGRRHGPLD